MGGWVDPNCLMIDKLACEPLLRVWSIPLQGAARGRASDRNVFHNLNRHCRAAATDQATVYYQLTPTDRMHPARLAWMGAAYDAAASR
jgi:hypothetical protein